MCAEIASQHAESVARAEYDEMVRYVSHYQAKALRYKMEIEALQDIADRLAEAIRNHGPWMDDKCREVLAAYDALLNDG